MVANGGRVRSLTVHPVLLVACFAFVLIFGLGYLGATTYLFFRDDLIGAAFARQARMQHAYEDRIAALRGEIDRISSRQLLDQEAFESKLDRLLTQQDLLRGRHLQVATVIEQAKQSGLRLTATAIPVSKPTHDTGDSTGNGNDAPTGIGGEFTPETPMKSSMLFPGIRGSAPSTVAAITSAVASEPEHRLQRIEKRLVAMTRSQSSALDAIAVAAETDSEKIAKTISRLGIRLAYKSDEGDDENSSTGIGGPFVPYIGNDFEDRVERAEQALDRFNRLRETAVTLPLRQPVPGATITSRYGRRLDPFLGRPALHTGIDFRGSRKTRVRVTAPGKVVRAGRMGGYGLCVEVDHGNGLSTRYAHMSQILVKVGQHLDAGDVVGRVGSTGRSTGPHLHYETRVHGRPVNPISYLRAGRELRSFMH